LIQTSKNKPHLLANPTSQKTIMKTTLLKFWFMV